MDRAQAVLTALALGTILGCGGGSGTGSKPAPPPTPTQATALAYTDPTGSYALVRNAALSTGTHLVLDLTGPATATPARGIALVLSLGSATQATWAPVTAGGNNYVAEGAVFNLGTGAKAMVGRTINGGADLQVALFQKGPNVPAATLGTAVLASVALELKSGSAPGPVALASVAGKAFVQDPAGVAVAITPSIGLLTAK